MQHICAWCQADLGEIESATHNDTDISHGICPSCANRIRAEMGEPLQEFLDRLDAPVLLLESGARVVTANKCARDMLGKELSEIQAHRGGEVIECMYANMPGGCGEQLHCKSCTIRNTVLETYETGKSFLHVKAFPDIQVGRDTKTMSLEISTEKVADMVLLRIDDYSEAQP